MAISTLLTKIEINPKQILLWDAIGALITVIMLLGVLAPLEPYFGMPGNVLYFLSAVGLCMFLYSIICYRIINKQWPRFLKIAIVANALYIVMSIGLVIIYAHKLKTPGFVYFALEFLVIGAFVVLEYKTHSNFKQFG